MTTVNSGYHTQESSGTKKHTVSEPQTDRISEMTWGEAWKITKASKGRKPETEAEIKMAVTDAAAILGYVAEFPDDGTGTVRLIGNGVDHYFDAEAGGLELNARAAIYLLRMAFSYVVETNPERMGTWHLQGLHAIAGW